MSFAIDRQARVVEALGTAALITANGCAERVDGGLFFALAGMAGAGSVLAFATEAPPEQLKRLLDEDPDAIGSE